MAERTGQKQTKQIEKQQTAADHLVTRFEWTEPATPVSLVETLAYWQTDLEKQRSHQQTIEAKIPSGAREKDRTGSFLFGKRNP